MNWNKTIFLEEIWIVCGYLICYCSKEQNTFVEWRYSIYFLSYTSLIESSRLTIEWARMYCIRSQWDYLYIINLLSPAELYEANFAAKLNHGKNNLWYSFWYIFLNRQYFQIWIVLLMDFINNTIIEIN